MLLLLRLGHISPYLACFPSMTMQFFGSFWLILYNKWHIICTYRKKTVLLHNQVVALRNHRKKRKQRNQRKQH